MIQRGIAICVSIIVILVITGVILSGFISQKDHAYLQQKDGLFKAMNASIEFNGISEEVKTLASSYAKLYPGGKANVIITDASGKVLFSLNQGFMPQNDRFLVAVSTDEKHSFSNDAFILDDNKEIRYILNVNNPDNTFKLKEFSSQLGVKLPSNRNDSYEVERTVDGIKKNIKIDFNNSYNSSYDMQYAYIGSKGLNLYTIFDGSYFYEQHNSDPLYVLRDTIGKILILFFILFWLSLPLWVFMDASSRDFKAPLWSILTLATNVIGLLVYLTVRPEYKKCISCEQALDKSFIACPYCGTMNRTVCSNCKQVLEDTWSVCPYCATRQEAHGEELSNVSETVTQTLNG
ncbi:MAG: zinc ribbon domain-containing protein [Clostridia bacterium]|nr:zinc ribbon domain-containing protein [Clostridia bacterium]